MKSRINALFMLAANYLSGPVLITIGYFIFGFFWILFSDWILLKFSSSSENYIQFQTYKGWFYIVITTILVYALSKVYATHKEKSLNLSREKEQIISENLKEKEILLKEIHHRVKNNMQIMISLLRLKSRYSQDDGYQMMFKEIMDKIHAIALVHEMLYQADLLSEVNFRDYIQEITNHLLLSLDAGNRVKINTDLDEIILPMEVAVPCGILMNEIITTTLKYAFPDSKKGSIYIRFKKIPSNKCQLQIRDDGKGFDVSVPPDKDHSFEIRLIHILSDQLNAALDIVSEETGTTYTMTLDLP